MNKYLKIAGIVVVAAGVLYYPALKLYEYLSSRNSDEEGEEAEHHLKAFAPAWRGKHKFHSRQAHNGHTASDNS